MHMDIQYQILSNINMKIHAGRDPKRSIFLLKAVPAQGITQPGLESLSA